MAKNRLVFLGTAGGRGMVFSQERRSGGLLLELDGKKLMIDPGPGTLVHAQSLKLQPEKLSALLISHLHVDHVTDANVLLGGMETPVVIAEEHCLRKKSDFDDWPKITSYHQKISEVFPVTEGKAVELGGVRIEAAKANHTCPCVGFVVMGSKKIGYASDGMYFKGQEQFYEGCDVLVLNVHVPKGVESTDKYMSVDDAILLLRGLRKKPRLTVISHLSHLMVRNNLWRQIKIIGESTGCSVIFADDFMELDIDNPAAAPRMLKP